MRKLVQVECMHADWGKRLRVQGRGELGILWAGHVAVLLGHLPVLALPKDRGLSLSGLRKAGAIRLFVLPGV